MRTRDWGFKPDHIQVPTNIWHAQDDNISKHSSAKLFSESIPKVKFHTFSEDGHYVLYSKFQEIVEAI